MIARNIPQRWRDHRRLLSLGHHHSIKLQRSWRKHGADAFAFDILEIVAEACALLQREQVWIDALRAADPRRGFNVLPIAGSPLGAKRSPEARKRMSAAAKGKPKPPRSAEHRAAISAANKRRGTISPETRAKMIAGQAGRSRQPHSTETRAKLSAAAKRRGMLPETLQRAWSRAARLKAWETRRSGP